MRSSKVLHIQKTTKNQNNKTTEQQNLIRIRKRIPQKYFTCKKQQNYKTIKQQKNKRIKQQNLIRVRVRIPQKYFTNKTTKQQNNKTTKQQNNKI